MLGAGRTINGAAVLAPTVTGKKRQGVVQRRGTSKRSFPVVAGKIGTLID
jgi:hypothetical protein